MRIFKSHLLFKLINSYLVYSSVPSNINYLFIFGSLLAFCLVRIVTGDLLRSLLKRAYESLEWGLSSPPKPHSFTSLPAQSLFVTSLLLTKARDDVLAIAETKKSLWRDKYHGLDPRKRDEPDYVAQLAANKDKIYNSDTGEKKKVVDIMLSNKNVLEKHYANELTHFSQQNNDQGNNLEPVEAGADNSESVKMEAETPPAGVSTDLEEADSPSKEGGSTDSQEGGATHSEEGGAPDSNASQPDNVDALDSVLPSSLQESISGWDTACDRYHKAIEWCIDMLDNLPK